ncbi:MAG: ATP-binding protein, partial [Gammaproteobacteria bacterium]
PAKVAPVSMQNATKPQQSFLKQLTAIFTLGILALAFIASLTTASITSINVYGQMVEDGLQVTKTLSEQAVLALIYRSSENAEDAVQAAMGFPAIVHVALVTADNSILLSNGVYASSIPSLASHPDDAILARETIDEWVFVAPVFSEGPIRSEEFAILYQDEPQGEFLGHVVVVKSKDTLKKIVIATIITTLGVALFVAVILLFIVKRRFNYLTQPLSELSQMMAKAEHGDTRVHATPNGPIEVYSIARAFNKMMEALAERDKQLRRHNELLEFEVSQRTQDLVYARDMAVQASRNKSNFLSSVSHELRTPLQSIIGYSDLILEDLPPELSEIHHDVETIIHNASHLLAMINSVLDMSKLESGRMSLQLEEINIISIIEDVVETVTPLMSNNHNKLKHIININNPMLNIDEAKFRQILLNLLGNAAKFTEKGDVLLTVQESDKSLHIRVQDNGIGMNREQLEHIFDPFYQIDSGLTRRFQGTGLGLAITNQFCKLMGGSISVDSTPNEGAIFDVDIPLPIKEASVLADL